MGEHKVMINYHDEQLNKLSGAISDLHRFEDYNTSDLYDVEKSYELLVEQLLLLDDYLHERHSLNYDETLTIKKLVNAMKEGK